MQLISEKYAVNKKMAQVFQHGPFFLWAKDSFAQVFRLGRKTLLPSNYLFEKTEILQNITHQIR